MTLKRQHPDVPAANARLKDKVLFRPAGKKRYVPGEVVEIGIKNQGGHPLNVGIWYEGIEKPRVPFVVSHYPNRVNPKEPDLIVLPPDDEVALADPDGKLRAFAKRNRLLIARTGGNSDDVRYRLVSKTGLEMTFLAESTESADVRWIPGEGFSNGKLSMEGSGHSFGVGDKVIIPPDEFEPSW